MICFCLQNKTFSMLRICKLSSYVWKIEKKKRMNSINRYFLRNLTKLQQKYMYTNNIILNDSTVTHR